MGIHFDSEEENLVLEKFKEVVSDLNLDDVTLKRFLRARQHNVAKAEEMLRKSEQWKIENNVRSYSKWKLPTYLIDKFQFIFKITECDHLGHPVLWLPFGTYRMKELFESEKSTASTVISEFAYHVCEYSAEIVKNRRDHQVTVVIDLENLPLGQVIHIESMQNCYQVFQKFEKNYPETLHKVFIINAPFIFPVGFNFVKPILSQATMNKITIFGCNKGKWLAELTRCMPKSAIAEKYLGN